VFESSIDRPASDEIAPLAVCLYLAVVLRIRASDRTSLCVTRDAIPVSKLLPYDSPTSNSISSLRASFAALPNNFSHKLPLLARVSVILTGIGFLGLAFRLKQITWN